ncbi:hypothetical protein HS088_TW09G01218 [Tripterygium wilfordii]|uniref:Uncharacterized protein n=1 Tax=Tripterygium wilfordii TaxID=458696 RepID=A0A7J7D9Y6_TRIWF|nr:hypothetical protein HS088_TW09G01218 [Tripterygium wilfordii]
MFVNGSKITSQFQQESKRLSMRTSKFYVFLARSFGRGKCRMVLVTNSCLCSNNNPLFQISHFRFVKKKFEELYYQSTTPDHVDRVFKIYRTTALDPKLVKKTFKLVDETLRRRNLFEAGLL